MNHGSSNPNNSLRNNRPIRTIIHKRTELQILTTRIINIHNKQVTSHTIKIITNTHRLPHLLHHLHQVLRSTNTITAVTAIPMDQIMEVTAILRSTHNIHNRQFLLLLLPQLLKHRPFRQIHNTRTTTTLITIRMAVIISGIINKLPLSRLKQQPLLLSDIQPQQ
ncbi:hypothetical protein BDB00DRAFT_38277 [Zychaea mexicana]|uniref:uncharacterized protein n=1 Tax=Zychaea mexicana TaxID=64656 RepID=UPI0022FEEFE2|nr:uncharacterized protein BDB00DRAFT_38277 [Zychaea mexicana]KAI9488528.1 hypothetical protein BDB00DRAFT_38277 [Zychaea mexicana]